jgi:hypothetical protein
VSSLFFDSETFPKSDPPFPQHQVTKAFSSNEVSVISVASAAIS